MACLYLHPKNTKITVEDRKGESEDNKEKETPLPRLVPPRRPVLTKRALQGLFF